MLNEWKEFLQYTSPVSYTATGKRDNSYLGRFTYTTLTDFEGMARILTILARGYLFHDENGNALEGNPKARIEFARRALLAWCSIPDSKKATPKEEWHKGYNTGKQLRRGILNAFRNGFHIIGDTRKQIAVGCRIIIGYRQSV